MIYKYKADNRTELTKLLGEELFLRQSSNRHVCTAAGDDAYFLAFSRCNTENIPQKEERISVYCSRSDIYFFFSDAKLGERIAAYDDGKEPFRTLADFLSDLTIGDTDILERLEKDINSFEDGLITATKTVKGASARIISLRRTLLKLKRYYDQLGAVCELLADDENNIISADALHRIVSVSRRISRLGSTVEHLRECVTQVREAYQAQIDIEQNQIMKIFTVLTAVFSPLTLIAGWYGMNFKMPEYGWRFGYAFVIILSIAALWLSIIIFKRKKWF